MDSNEIKAEIGLRIKAYRCQNKLTQEEFSSIIGLEQSNLSNIENGKKFPDITTLCAIIEKNKIEPNYLLGFLNNNTNKFDSIDFEIINLLINLPEKSKIFFKQFLESLNR